MANPPFSFIVPIYNAEAYLFQCLASIRQQTLTDFEVIMIDDGSTDGSSQIAKSFEKKDPRFCYVRQKNAGTSEATNAALERAKGQFIINVDNDDYVSNDLLVRAEKIIEEESPDIIQFQCVFINSTGEHNSQQDFLDNISIFRGHELARDCERRMPGAFDRTHSRKIIRRKIIEGLRFIGNSKGADTSFIRRALFRCEKVVLSPERLFFIRELGTSESRKPNPPYLYKEWFVREISDIDFCIRENAHLNRERPFWEFGDLLDMWQMFAAKAIRDRTYDAAFFRTMGKDIWKRKRFLVPKGVRSYFRWYCWLHFTKLMSKKLSGKLCPGDFII